MPHKLSPQRRWSDVEPGDELPEVAFPVTAHHAITTAGVGRDFNSIGRNREPAQAPDIYANVMFLQGMWERCARDYIGLAGTLRSLRNFKMHALSVAGSTAVVRGRVKRKWRNCEDCLVELELWTEDADGVSVGPGSVVATLPA